LPLSNPSARRSEPHLPSLPPFPFGPVPHTRMVADFLWLISVSRSGVTEKEVIEVLSISQELFSRLSHWLGPLIVSRRGLICFRCEVCLEAVELVFLADLKVAEQTAQRLATYFDTQRSKGHLTSRVIEELPWLLQKAGNVKGLKDCLADLDFFEAVWCLVVSSPSISRELTSWLQFGSFLRGRNPWSSFGTGSRPGVRAGKWWRPTPRPWNPTRGHLPATRRGSPFSPSRWQSTCATAETLKRLSRSFKEPWFCARRSTPILAPRWPRP